MNLKDKIEKVKMCLANSESEYSKLFKNPKYISYDDLIKTCIKIMHFDGKNGIEDVANFVIELADQYYQQMASEAILYSIRKF